MPSLSNIATAFILIDDFLFFRRIEVMYAVAWLLLPPHTIAVHCRTFQFPDLLDTIGDKGAGLL
jgi:hypothetical protein